MKITVAAVLALVVPPALAVNSVAALHQGEVGTLLMAVNDMGMLHNFDRNEWTALGVPCPGEPPFSLHLTTLASINDTALIFVVDAAGTCYQTDGDVWEVFLEPPDSSAGFSTGAVFSTSDTHLAVVLVDVTGEIFIHSPGGTCRQPFPVFPAVPVRDMAVYYDVPTDILNLFIIGADGNLYACIRGEWESAAMPENQWDIQRIEMNVNPRNGDGFIVASDRDGYLYSNANGPGLRLADYDCFPEPGPWDLELIHSGGESFDLLCIDPEGRLYQAVDGSWETVTSSFPEN